MTTLYDIFINFPDWYLKTMTGITDHLLSILTTPLFLGSSAAIVLGYMSYDWLTKNYWAATHPEVINKPLDKDNVLMQALVLLKFKMEAL